MLTHILTTLRVVLWPSWNARLPEATSAAKELPEEMGIRDAYLRGYRTAYWDALVDMVDANLIKSPPSQEMGEPVLPWFLTPTTNDFH